MILRILLGITLLFGLLKSSQAQVEGLSYEIGAAGEYMFFDDEVGIENGALLGGEFGFGFGQLLELKGSYFEGVNLERDFSGLSEPFEGLANLDVDLKRYGGEVQINLLKSAIKPYLTFGAGVQEIEGDGLAESSSLYFKGGLGILLTANDRFAWNLFGNFLTFNANPYSTLLTDAERATYNINLADKDFDNSVNYSVGTKLNFYLGGRDPDKLTGLDRALQRSFQTGLRGTTFQFEPTYGWLDFHEDLPFRNAQTVGAKLGVDFGPYFGIRAFYHQAMVDGEFLEFDDLSMFGGEAVFNLNEPNGIVPFITIGGGYMNVDDNYVGRENITAEIESKPFATGGLGLRIPLADVFLLKGSIKSVIMTNEDIEDVVSTQDVTNSWTYEVGVEFKLGKKAEKLKVVEMSEYDKVLYELQRQAESERDALITDSDAEIQRLKNEIAGLKQNNESMNQPVTTDQTNGGNTPTNTAETMGDESNSTSTQSKGNIVIPRMEEGEVYIRFGEADNTLTNVTKEEEIEIVEQKQKVDTVYMAPDGIVMQPEELQSLIESLTRPVVTTTPAATTTTQTIVDTNSVGATDASRNVNTTATLANDYNDLLIKNKVLELELEQMKTVTEKQNEEYERRLKEELDDAEEEYKKKLLEKELRDTKKELRNYESNKAQMAEGNHSADTMSNVINDQSPAEMFGEKNDSTGTFLKYKYSSGMALIGLGEANGFGLGFRTHYGIRNTTLDLVPQVYYGIIGQRQYGFDFNVQTPILKGKYNRFKPYAGAGIGLAGLEDNDDRVDNTLTFNLIIGTNFYTKHGHLYFDYTNRNFFKMNQLAAGYVFNF